MEPDAPAPQPPHPDDFYVRYYTGHRDGRGGSEFLELELNNEGRLRYANRSAREGSTLRREARVSEAVLREAKRMVVASGVMAQDDAKWPEPTPSGRVELEVVCGGEHVSFATAVIGSAGAIDATADPEGLRAFFFLSQDLKCFLLSLITMHFKKSPFG